MKKLHKDNECKNLYKEFEYKPKALKIMYDMQMDLQRFMCNKYKNVASIDSDDITALSYECLYYWGCATAEYDELIERLEKEKLTDNDKLEIQYEYIDIWHFLMNVFIYAGVKKIPITFDKLYDILSETLMNTDTLDHKVIGSFNIDYVMSFWDIVVKSIGELFNNIPYKKWKTYKNISINEQKVLDIVITIILFFLSIGIILKIDKNIFYNLYCTKNEENFNRQKPGNIYGN